MQKKPVVAKYAVAYAHNITLCYVTLTFTYLVTWIGSNRMFFLIQKVNYEFCREIINLFVNKAAKPWVFFHVEFVILILSSMKIDK